MRSSKYMVFDKKSIPMVACSRKAQKGQSFKVSGKDTNAQGPQETRSKRGVHAKFHRGPLLRSLLPPTGDPFLSLSEEVGLS